MTQMILLTLVLCCAGCAAGQVVDVYAKTDNTQHGFLATPTKK
jgi:hypothetical protein